MTFDLYPEVETKFLEAIAYYENCAPRLGAGLRKPADPKKGWCVRSIPVCGEGENTLTAGVFHEHVENPAVSCSRIEFVQNQFPALFGHL